MSLLSFCRDLGCIARRPYQRLLVLLFLWTFVCYFVFKTNLQNELVRESYAQRELLRQMVKSRPIVHRDSAASSTQVPTSTEINILEAEIAIDDSPQLNESDLVKELQSQLQNLPITYLQENKNKNWHYKNETSCAKFPALYDIHFNNIYWQQVDTSNGTFFLYGAYLDIRKRNKLGPSVRVLSMINRLEPAVVTYCQFWFKGLKEPVISKVVEYKYIWYKKWGNYKTGIFQPYLMVCQIPKSHWKMEPVSVSIVENICDTAKNNLRVIHNKMEGPEKHKFAVCVKGLDFPKTDLSVRLAEWIELLNVLGAHKIFMYSLEVHPNVTKVLNHYVEKGFIDVTPISLPGYQPNMPNLQHLYLKRRLNNKRQNELIPYNDCLYRNMYRYEYIALLDIDEVILPKQHSDWFGMMEEIIVKSMEIRNETRASYNFRNVYFLDEMLTANGGKIKEIPPYLHMMQHIYRSANYTKPGQYVKCFHNPEKALILHNHFPLGCLGACTSYPVDTTLAHMQHYRADCVSALKSSCQRDYKNASVRDTTMWKWKTQVITRTTGALSKLGFFKHYKLPEASGMQSVLRPDT